MNSNYSYLGKYASKEKKQSEQKVESQNYIIQGINQIQSNRDLYDRLSRLHSVYCDCWNKLAVCNIPEINAMLTISYQALSNDVTPNLCMVPYKNNLYYYINNPRSIVSEINKTIIIKKITEESIKKQFEQLFDAIYKYLELNKNNNLSVIYIYLKYIARENVNIYKLLISLPQLVPTITEKQPYIKNAFEHFIYKLYNHTPMVSFNGYNEMFPFNLDFFIRHLDISIEKQYEEDITTLISLLKKYIKTSCINHSTPQSTIYYDIYKNDFMPQNYKLELKNSNCILKSISDSINEPLNHTLEPFRPMCLYDDSTLHTVVNNHTPKALYTYLTSMCNNKPTLDTVVKIITTSLMSINIKRKVAIITCNEKNIDSVKMFFKKILTINDNTYKAVIDEGFDAINLNKPGFIEELRALNYSNAKALFLSNTREEFSVNKLSGIIEKTKPLLMQTFIFQLDTIESTFPQKDCIHLDLSKWIPPENCTFSDNDALWAKIYLPIYGLHILFKDRKNTNKFDFPDIFESKKIIFEERDNVIKKMCSDFIKGYFVSIDEALKRKKNRRVAIREIRSKNPGCTDELIIKQLDKSLEFSTFGEDFETYAKLYLDTQYTPSLLEQYNITAEDIKDCLKNMKTFKYDDVLAMLYFTGKVNVDDKHYILDLLERAAKQGDHISQYKLGTILFEGLPLENGLTLYKYSEALDWLSKAATNGYADAQFYLGTLLFQSKHVIRDVPDAIKNLINAFEQNNINAINYLNNIIKPPNMNIENSQSLESILRACENAAKKGDAKSQFFIGVLYYIGKLLPKSYAEAYHWFQKASNQNYTEAIYQLGIMHYFGEGVPKDFNEAYYYFEKAAFLNHCEANYMIGKILFEYKHDVLCALQFLSNAANRLNHMPSKQKIV